ncbi:mycoredoxin [Salininema proteolyticum]|uniref:Mycoredoxin n=1 Tax=Salininema proteolyticum TaxID=1607685 RepID=A0ABV8TXI6_9ACTN
MVEMFSTTWCAYCKRLKVAMDRAGIAYKETNIEEDPEAADWVMNANGGNQTVPTLRFEDGSALTNPSIGEVKAKLGV